MPHGPCVLCGLATEGERSRSRREAEVLRPAHADRCRARCGSRQSRQLPFHGGEDRRRPQAARVVAAGERGRQLPQALRGRRPARPDRGGVGQGPFGLRPDERRSHVADGRNAGLAHARDVGSRLRSTTTTPLAMDAAGPHLRQSMTAPRDASPADPVSRRRTFAIILHPDAGKTTLTEKLLLFGGAIQLAGEVKAKKNRVQTRSDWMGIERERGISVVTSVMTFEYGDCVFNLLDTPGHEDFSEDTYRTLTAVDSAVMVIDAAKGIEARTRKLFEVCRLRDIPIVTFVNKMDRESRDPFDLLDEIEKTLALDTAPVTWPIGRGRSFAGTYDLARNLVRRLDADEAPMPVDGPASPAVEALLPEEEREAWREEIALAQDACRPFELKAFREGHLTPVFFGSALKNFGVRDLIDALAEFAPPPRAQSADTRLVAAHENRMTGFVFKIQANMDPNHRDRIAFMRVCSGRLTRGMKAKLVRTGKPISLSAPQFFFARDRAIADEAFAG